MDKKEVRGYINSLSSDLSGTFGIGGSNNGSNDIDLVYIATKIKFNKLLIFKKAMEKKTEMRVSISPMFVWQLGYPETWSDKVAVMAFKKEIEGITLKISWEEVKKIIKMNAIPFASLILKDIASGKMTESKAVELLLQEVLILGGE